MRLPCATLTLALVLLAPGRAAAQTATVLFDEDDAAGADYREASAGFAEAGDSLTLAGPDADKMPVVGGQAFRGATSGLLEYRHAGGGAWTLDIAADGFSSVDLADADSLVFFLNGPLPVAGPDLPRFALVDADGRATARLGVTTGGIIGLNAFRSGFEAGSTTDARLRAEYLEALPPTTVRPGYPEDLLVTFSDAVLDTSRAVIGAPGVPAKFRVETAFTGLRLAFSFSDLDGDSTLGAAGEFIDVFTPEEEGSGRQRPAWRLTVVAEGAAPPGPGDVYRLAVNNGGLDGDPATWQRIGVSLRDFGPPGDVDFGRIQRIRFSQGASATGLRTLWVDYVAGIDRGADPGGPPAPVFTAQPGDSSVVLRWAPVAGATGTHVYRQAAPGQPFERLTTRPAREPHFADLDARNGTAYHYVLRSLGSGGAPGPDSAPLAAAPRAGLPDAYLDLLAETAFAYFWTEANPANGLVKDRSTAGSASSIAAVGFGLSAITVGIDRGWITREEGVARVLATLEFFASCPQGEGTSGTCGYRGFFYHFLDMQTGLRAGTNELSTIDTALLLGGVLHAGAYFDGSTADEQRIRDLADALNARIEWDWAAPRAPLVALGWRPETGFIGFDWRGYNEAMLLYVLALGSPTHPLPPAAWDAWTSTYVWATHYGIDFVQFPPLFGHQYSHVWIDFRGIPDAYMRAKGIDYFENSRRATLANRAYAIANPRGYPNYGPDEWGLTASDDPFGYRAHGAPPAQSDNGTLTPTAAGGSFAFTPAESATALRTFYRRYRDDLWGPYGLRDAYNVRENWFATDYLGIDQGPILLMIENERTGAIWERFMTVEAVQRGLERAGFDLSVAAGDPAEARAVPVLGDVYPNPFRGAARIPYTVPAPGPVRVSAYDVLGRRVALLADGIHPAGTYAILWAAEGMASGVYLIRLEAAGRVRTRPVVLLR